MLNAGFSNSNWPKGCCIKQIERVQRENEVTFNSSEFLKLFKAKLMEKYSTNELTMKHRGFLNPNFLFICNKKYLIFSIIDGFTYSIKFE
jgi:hypothetical protein